jgi:hypothetical protein
MLGVMSEPDLRYPIGPFQNVGTTSEAQRASFVQQIAETPEHLAAAVRGLSDEQLDTPYRPGGWTARQVTHHVPDSHLNAYIRLKLALTEESPIIKPYEEHLWAELADGRRAPVAVSLALLTPLHERWVMVLRSLSSGDCGRTFVHPERGVMTIDELIAMYAWHGRHHVAHITSLRERKGWG